MHHAGESSEPTRVGEAVSSARGLLELSSLIRRQPTVRETLRAVAAAVADALGFGTTVVSVYRPERDDYEVVAVHGSRAAAGDLLGRVIPARDWAPLLDDRFIRHGARFIPQGAVDAAVPWHRPAAVRPSPAAPGDWRDGDALLATLDGPDGRRYGILGLDDPLGGRRPDDHLLQMLGALAAHAALAIESSHQVAALEAAVARNRAVIASAIDSVVAVDVEDRVIEFNPAAERMFGYRSQDVLGSRGAELLVPPELREVYRRNLRRLRDDPGSRLLDRRIETSAMRSDGTTFPIEATVARVEGADGDDPTFYAFVRDISSRRRTEEQLAYLAYHDALTGLPNRLMVEQQLDLALARARRSGGAAALMFVDLDDFKEVNDRLGHAAGDRLLAAVAARLRGVLRGSDILARQGGDEFLVLLADLGDDAAAAAGNVGAKLLDALREPFSVAGTEIRTGASIGVSLYPADASDTEVLLRHADAAMYHAKAAGGGRLSFHRAAAGQARRRGAAPEWLGSVLPRDELELRYQPIRRLQGDRGIIAVEALPWWRDPAREAPAPASFAALADQAGVGDQLLEWMIGEICRHARGWRREGLAPPVGINVSPQQLLSPGFAGRFAAQAGAAGLPLDGFLIELGEAAWEADAVPAPAVIEELRSLGAVLVLDDFGAGRSSLSRLPELGFDLTKVAGRLLRDVPGDAAASRLLEAILLLAGACGAPALAEGVDTSEQARFLVRHGVQAGQGRWLGPPLPGDQLTPVLRQALVSWSPPRRGS